MIRNAAVGAALVAAPLELDLERVPAGGFRPETPSEEFRTLRTRLEQLQATRTIQTVLVASPSEKEGKSFTAGNLALAEAQLPDNPTLLCDFDLRKSAGVAASERSPAAYGPFTERVSLDSAGQPCPAGGFRRQSPVGVGRWDAAGHQDWRNYRGFLRPRDWNSRARPHSWHRRQRRQPLAGSRASGPAPVRQPPAVAPAAHWSAPPTSAKIRRSVGSAVQGRRFQASFGPLMKPGLEIAPSRP